jgi:anti-anti-sigma factor
MSVQIAQLRSRSVDGIRLAAVAGELDHSNAAGLLSALLSRLTNDDVGLVLDFTDVTYVDSAGIRIIFVLREQLTRRGQELRLVVSPTAATNDALSFTGVPQFVGICATGEAAMDSIREAI